MHIQRIRLQVGERLLDINLTIVKEWDTGIEYIDSWFVPGEGSELIPTLTEEEVEFIEDEVFNNTIPTYDVVGYGEMI